MLQGLRSETLYQFDHILGIIYTGNAEQLRERIIRALMDIGSPRSICDEDEDDEEDDDDENHDESDSGNNEENDNENADFEAEEEHENIVQTEQGNHGRPKRDTRQRHANCYV